MRSLSVERCRPTVLHLASYSPKNSDNDGHTEAAHNREGCYRGKRTSQGGLEAHVTGIQAFTDSIVTFDDNNVLVPDSPSDGGGKWQA